VIAWPEVGPDRSFGGNLKGLTSFFVRAKHWQVFILVWGTYFVGQMAIVRLLQETSGHIENPLKVGLISEAIMLPFVVCFMGWLWSMGSFLFSILEPSLKPSIHFFWFAIIFSTLYLLMGLPFWLSDGPVVEHILIPLHLLALFCILYALYFVSKSLAVAEKGEAVTRNDYTLTLFLLFFSPIGIWLVQPRINRLCGQNSA
jgi:hypothetical protein